MGIDRQLALVQDVRPHSLPQQDGPLQSQSGILSHHETRLFRLSRRCEIMARMQQIFLRQICCPQSIKYERGLCKLHQCHRHRFAQGYHGERTGHDHSKESTKAYIVSRLFSSYYTTPIRALHAQTHTYPEWLSLPTSHMRQGMTSFGVVSSCATSGNIWSAYSFLNCTIYFHLRTIPCLLFASFELSICRGGHFIDLGASWRIWTLAKRNCCYTHYFCWLCSIRKITGIIVEEEEIWERRDESKETTWTPAQRDENRLWHVNDTMIT